MNLEDDMLYDGDDVDFGMDAECVSSHESPCFDDSIHTRYCRPKISHSI